ncbi:MAG: hypothetical protein RMK49_03770 [Abditibacteriales bacterium]|nr:hypothetical protein [Abditibacteriales bacterium]
MGRERDEGVKEGCSQTARVESLSENVAARKGSHDAVAARWVT